MTSASRTSTLPCLVRIQRDASTHMHGNPALAFTNPIATTLRTHVFQTHEILRASYIGNKPPPSPTHYTTNKHKIIPDYALQTSHPSTDSHLYGNTTSPNHRNLPYAPLALYSYSIPQLTLKDPKRYAATSLLPYTSSTHFSRIEQATTIHNRFPSQPPAHKLPHSHTRHGC
jgi:hypothetical protein